MTFNEKTWLAVLAFTVSVWSAVLFVVFSPPAKADQTGLLYRGAMRVCLTKDGKEGCGLFTSTDLFSTRPLCEHSMVERAELFRQRVQAAAPYGVYVRVKHACFVASGAADI